MRTGLKVSILGGGPAGLYLALLLKRNDASTDVSVVERNRADATFGWGVVFSDRTLGSFRDADLRSYVQITDSLIVWDAIDIRYRDDVIRCGGQTFSGISRIELLQILQRRCAEEGVRTVFENELPDLGQFEGSDLIVGADGANSTVRRLLEEEFRPRVSLGRAKYVWFGTTYPFDAFTFIFRERPEGLFQVHAYPFDGTTSTFIVECAEETWGRAGLDRMSEEESLAFCEDVFADDLRGHRLLTNRSLWQSFPTIRARTWRHGNVVLVGDAAHTAHFSIGSGTKLAMEDAIGLADAMARHDDLDSVLAWYEADRRPVVERFQKAAAQSRRYFESTARYLHMEPVQFAFHLLSRSGRMDYANIRVRDPAFAASVDAWFSGASMRLAPQPAFVPLTIRDTRLDNRVVAGARPAEDAQDGLAGDAHRAALERAAATGAALLLTEIAAVEPEGRITPACPGLWDDEHGKALAQALEAIRSRSVMIGVRLGHAGRRGSTRPRELGVDRPLRKGEDAWRTIAASPIPYRAGMPAPKQISRKDMDRVRDAFAAAARRALDAGADLVQVHMAHGYLLAGFLSPLSNARSDGYGGSLENRMKFPLEVFDAVREAWASDRPVAVALTADDRAPGGLMIEDTVHVAAALRDRGCDLIEVLAGQGVANDRPIYDPADLADLSERIRIGAGIPTIATGAITTVDQINTVLAAGRADLCSLLF